MIHGLGENQFKVWLGFSEILAISIKIEVNEIHENNKRRITKLKHFWLEHIGKAERKEEARVVKLIIYTCLSAEDVYGDWTIILMML